MADKTIPDLTAAASVALTDLIEIAQPASKKATVTQLQAAITSGFVPTSRTIGTTAPLAGGGDLSADRTFSIADAVADGATKGAATFLAADFTSAAGVIGIDYANGQSASAVNKGFLTSADWTTFNGKASNEAPFVDTTAIVKGSADATKLLRFEVDGFTTGTTRIATPPNQNFTIAGIDVIQTFSAAQTFTPAANTVAVNINAVSVTGASSQVFSRIVGTWNTSGTPSAFLIGITDTASNAASLLMQCQVGGSDVFSIGKTGAINFVDNVRQTFNPGANASGLNVGSVAGDPGTPVNGDLWYESGANELHARINGATVALGAGGGSPPFSDATAIIKGSADATKLLRIEVDGLTTGTTRVATPPNQDFTFAGINVQQTFTQKQTITPPVDTEALVVSGFSATGSSTAAILDLSGTWNTSGAPKAISLNITNVTSDATAELLDLQVGGSTVFSVDLSGFATMNGGALLGSTLTISSVFSVNGATGLATWADGVRQTFNPNGTNAGLNVGAHTADPSVLVNGDLWYQSTANALRARINGATVDLGAGGGSPPFIDSTAIIKGSADATKLLRIEVDGFTTATTRVATPPNQDFAMAGINVAQTFSVKQTFTPAVNTEAIAVTGFSLTGSNAQSVLDLAGTWNTTGAPTAIKLSITNTASDTFARLLDLRVGANTVFYVNKTGTASIADGLISLNSDGSAGFATGAFTIDTSGAFMAVSGGFVVDGLSNLTINSVLTFNNSGFTVTDNGSAISFSSNLELLASITFTSGGLIMGSDGTNFTFSSNIQVGTALISDDSGAVGANTFKAATALQVGNSQFQEDTGDTIICTAANGFGLSGSSFVLQDVSGDLVLTDGDFILNTGSIKFGIAAAAGLLIATHSITVRDSSGASFNLLCRSV